MTAWRSLTSTSAAVHLSLALKIFDLLISHSLNVLRNHVWSATITSKNPQDG
jgi:hypothetical protein